MKHERGRAQHDHDEPGVKPFCFVLMPFGRKPDGSSRIIDFDAIYEDVIKPAVADADLEPIRADEEKLGGLIHKSMFERLTLCRYAVADLTTANAHVFYELGVRHGIRPHSTVLIFGRGTNIPFDVNGVKALPYSINRRGNPGAAEEDRRALAARLIACHNPVEDSPLFQLLGEIPRPDIARLRTDNFRTAVEYSRHYKDKLAQARALGKRDSKGGLAAVAAVERDLKCQHREHKLHHVDPPIIVDLLLSYRAVKGHQEMISLVGEMSEELAGMVLVREQHAFALNRLERHDEAEGMLKELIDDHGPNSETNGLLGRVYKDMWRKAAESGRIDEARGHLVNAVRAYTEGFHADIRDVFPGINAATLMVPGYDQSRADSDPAGHRLCGGTATGIGEARLLGSCHKAGVACAAT
jgi:hypothetical protein